MIENDHRRVKSRSKIACVLTARRLNGEVIGAMNLIRFIRMSEALARRGHEVHVVVNGTIAHLLPADGPVEVPANSVRWNDYDIIKTVCHSGFAALDAWGGAGHPFIVSNLGSVVGPEDEEGVYFHGGVREELWSTQQKIAAKSRVISFLTERNRDLFHRLHADHQNHVFVPCGVDAVVPAARENPYTALGIDRPVALFAGNLYARNRQPEVNLFWQERLNRLGAELSKRGVRLVAIGPGETDRLDPAAVTHAGIVDFREIWDWQWHAGAGIVLAQGAVQDNESSKIYYYLRTGLPVVCETSVPNAWLVSYTRHGAVVEYDSEDLKPFADAAASLAHQPHDGRDVMDYMASRHSWDDRAAQYASLFASAID